MANIRRKGVKDYPRINNCRIHPDAFVALNQLAGCRSLGAAIEDLVNWFQAKKPNVSCGVSSARQAHRAG